MSTTTELARLVGFVATDLETRGYKFSGIVRQGARALLDAPEPNGDGCRGCGAELAQPVTGGKRLWCSEVCRRRSRR